jgi:arylsulfatase A-like enzyme
MFAVFICGSCQPVNEPVRTIIVIFDGLRPDYITAETMPNLYALSREGSYGKRHHSVYPTVTRVNASSYATGSYPATHGILGNTVYFPSIDSMKGLNTGEQANLRKIADHTGGNLLTAISLGEALQLSGHRLMVFSSGSTGQAFLQNHTISGGAIVHPDLVLPPLFREELVGEIGEPPGEGTPNGPQHEWITNALIRFGLAADGPLVNAIWYSDPDGTAHRDGIGATTAMEAITSVDAQFGRILQAIREQHLQDRFNIIVTADHGFITHSGDKDLSGFLIEEQLKDEPESTDVVIAGNAIYVKDRDPGTISAIVNRLLQQPWVGAVFTRDSIPGSETGSVPGTLSFSSIHWNHQTRVADILVAPNWDDRENDNGYAGTDFATGVAGHGGLSPYEVRIPLIAAGPAFRQAYESELPTSNIDIVPTILALAGIPTPSTMTGRVMTELFRNTTPRQFTTKTDTVTAVTNIPGGQYKLKMVRSWVDDHDYVDYAGVTRQDP